MMITTAIPQILALENGATLSVQAGVACDMTNQSLVQMAETLSQQMANVGIDLLAVRLEGDTLVATIDESQAEEPLSSFALRTVVERLSHAVMGRVLGARIEDATPDVAPATALVPAA